MRAAIYARYSSDRQSEHSTADQVSRCREFAGARGWSVIGEFVVEDAGISGASRHNRPALLDLIAAIDQWDVLLTWEFTRLARDSEDLAWIRNRLRAARKTGYEVTTGLDIFNVGSKVMGVLAEEYLVKLRADTRRGLRGRVERGLFAGGLPYGYRSDPVSGGRADPRSRDHGTGYRLVVDEDQAAVVRRIFGMYADGAGLRSIASTLNADGVAPPRPRRKALSPSWSVSALHSLLIGTEGACRLAC